MTFAHPEALVDGDWLEARLGQPDLRIVDATWFFESSGRDAAIEFELRHVPGAVFFDIDDIADTATDLPHMAPDAATFAAKVGALGIAETDHVVCYDGVGGFCAGQRAWWLFRLFGHERVSMLDGGLPRWIKEKRPIEKGEAAPRPVAYRPGPRNPGLIRDRAQVLANIEARAEQLLDARSEGRFAGIDHEPRPSERLGHIPGSINLPFTRLMDGKADFVMRGPDEIRAAFQDAGVDIDKPVAVTCGSGVTACVPAFALYLLGIETVPVYDGSWAEWGNRDDTPIAP